MTVSAGILKEADILARTLLTGVVLIFVYDLLRIIRRIIPHGKWWVGAEDFLFWAGSSIAIFAMLYRSDDGLLRGFSIGGVIIGMLAYSLLLSRFVVKGSVFVLEKIIHIIVVPIAGLARLLRRPLGFFWKIIKKVTMNLKKRLKKLLKAVKMGLYKK